jgi:DNA-binding XRE family transcriptional regulator
VTPPEKITPELGAWLRRARKARAMTQEGLASRLASLGISARQTTIAKIEGGSFEPSLSFALALFRLFGTTADAALGLSVTCLTCGGQPPEGYTCNTCGGAS